MKFSRHFSSAWFHCVVSILAVGGDVGGWMMWFTFGGWNRRSHTFEALAWAASVVVGLWSSIDTIRIEFGTNRMLWGMIAIVTGIFHILALLLLLMFLGMLADGGPRP
jgi:hypothetical protein